MNDMSRIFVALAVAGSIVGFGSQALASAKRDAIMQDCIAKAHKEWPDSGQEGVPRQRLAVYKACMAEAGQRP